jgi:hypothetical protein|tara:strand:- start:189 stop:431 length:243 start_codon:yes stop_codon:yes gene_type:complete
MANTHDYGIANDIGSAVRADMNVLFGEIEASNMGGSAPTNTATGKLWYDTATSTMKYYNGSSWEPVSSTGKMIAMSMIFG